METHKTNIWDEASEYAQKRTKNASKHRVRMKVQSFINAPIQAMRLILLLMTLYALYHYVPAFVNLKPVLTQTTTQAGALTQVENRKTLGAIAPLRDQFKMRKAYVRKGQILQAQYILPADASASITIKQCKRMIFIEAFNCKRVQDQTVDLSGQTSGTRRFQVAESAMYVLESRVETEADQRFDITWRRN